MACATTNYVPIFLRKRSLCAETIAEKNELGGRRNRITPKGALTFKLIVFLCV